MSQSTHTWKVDDLTVGVQDAESDIRPVTPLLRYADHARSSARADLLVTQARIEGSAGDPSIEEQATAVLYHSRTRVYRGAEHVYGWDGHSRFIWSKARRSLAFELHPASVSDPFYLINVTGLMGLTLALRDFSRFHLHAGVLQTDEGKTLIVAADSGSGKSTLCLALVEAGAKLITDDIAFLTRDPSGGPRIFGLARDLRLTHRSLAAFPKWRSLARPAAPSSGRDVYVRADELGAWSRACRGPFVLLVPHISGERVTRWQRVDAAESFASLMTASGWAAFPELAGHEAHLGTLTALADEAEGVELALGHDLLDAPAATAERLLADITR